MERDTRSEDQLRAARRNFLASCGRFAAVTPPVITLMVSGCSQNYATAASHGNPFKANNGYGNGGGDGVPGRSSHQDITR